MRDKELLLDGTDQTQKLTEVLSKVPAGETLIIRNGTLTISGEVPIPQNVAGIIFEGTTVKIDCREKRAGLLWRNASGILAGANFVLNGEFQHQTAAIYCLDAQHLTLETLTFKGDREDERVQKGHCILLRGRNRSVKNVSLFDIKIKSRIGTAKDIPVPILVEGELQGVARDHWIKNHVALKSKIPASNVRLNNVQVDGGYYGVSFSSVDSSTIELCTFRNNTRGVSVQNGSSYNDIKWNHIVDNVSAGIHLAYGSCWNNVQFNHLTSALAHGEGMLQAYVGSDHNRFTGNMVVVEGNGPKYHAYVGVESNGNFITDNLFAGPWLRACIGVESDWNSTLPYEYHRAFNAPNDDNYASGGMHDNMVAANVIRWNGERAVLFSEVNGFENRVLYRDVYPVTKINNPVIE